DIVPNLAGSAPNQPTAQALEDDPLLHRFVIVFDREGYSPALLLRMKKLHIACKTYHKYPKEDWSHDEFFPRQVTSASGHVTEMKLAERGTFIGKKIWVREMRKLCASGHQTRVISTNYKDNAEAIGVAMFARWSQENYFKYMRENYNLDALVDYCIEEISDTTVVVNPAYRRLDGEVRKKCVKR
ncbi:MAG: hypothetical protein V3T17_07240, partial [Pseudomonadales bacterium]